MESLEVKSFNESEASNESTSPSASASASASASLQYEKSRPFKSISIVNILNTLDKSTRDKYECYRRQCIPDNNIVANEKMMRTPKNLESKAYLNDEYLEKRQKNNMASKKSRDSRRLKENEIGHLMSFLKKEICGMDLEIQMLTERNHFLRQLQQHKYK